MRAESGWPVMPLAHAVPASDLRRAPLVTPASEEGAGSATASTSARSLPRRSSARTARPFPQRLAHRRERPRREAVEDAEPRGAGLFIAADVWGFPDRELAGAALLVVFHLSPRLHLRVVLEQFPGEAVELVGRLNASTTGLFSTEEGEKDERSGLRFRPTLKLWQGFEQRSKIRIVLL